MQTSGQTALTTSLVHAGAAAGPTGLGPAFGPADRTSCYLAAASGLRLGAGSGSPIHLQGQFRRQTFKLKCRLKLLKYATQAIPVLFYRAWWPLPRDDHPQDSLRLGLRGPRFLPHEVYARRQRPHIVGTRRQLNHFPPRRIEQDGAAYSASSLSRWERAGRGPHAAPPAARYP